MIKQGNSQPKKKKYTHSLPDDELRPWIGDEGFDAKIDEKITELNSFMTTCLPQKSAGGRGDSILDRPPDSLVLLGDLVEDENWIYEGDESVASNEVIEGEEINGDDIPETAISQDPEVLELTQKLGNYLEKSQKKESESKEEDLDYEERLKRYTLHKEKKKKKKLGSASYMPNMRSKMYKEWLEEQFAKSLSAPSDIWRRDDEASSQRPSTANITSFLAQQGVNDDEYFGLRPLTSSSSISTSSSSKYIVPNSPIRQLAPLSETSSSSSSNANINTNTTFFNHETNHSIRPHTQSNQTYSLPSPITTPSSSISRPYTQQSRSGVDNVPSVVFPSSNTDTIPSANSAIVKYKSSREYMLDKLQLPTKEQRENALKRSIERGTPLPLRSTSQDLHQNPNSNQNTRKSLTENPSQSQSRFQSSLNPTNPLTKIVISNDKGTAISKSNNNGVVYQKHQLRKVRNIRDQMLTTAGNASIYIGDQQKLPCDILDPIKSRTRTLAAAKLTKNFNEEDHTKELLKLPGFLENIGSDNFYMTSNSSTFNYPNNSFIEAIHNRDSPAVTKADLLKIWADDALLHGRKLFCYGGGGFHFAK